MVFNKGKFLTGVIIVFLLGLVLGLLIQTLRVNSLTRQLATKQSSVKIDKSVVELLAVKDSLIKVQESLIEEQGEYITNLEKIIERGSR